MSQTSKDFEQIDAFVAVAKTIDTFQHCHTVYDIFGIKDRGTPYPDIERIIEEFVRKYSVIDGYKFKNFAKIISGEAERIKRVLKSHQREYNDYLRENDPRAKLIRLNYEFCTRREEVLYSEDKSRLIEEGRGAGLSETEVRAFIARWVIETGVREVEARSGESTSWTPFADVPGKTYYEILGVADEAEYSEIKDAYEREHVKYNTSREKAKASARFYVVSEAWDCLKDSAKRRAYDEKLKQPKSPPPTGKPRLVVECKTDYTFRKIRRGAVINVDKIVIKNPDGGLLQGTIKSDVSWLEPDRNKILEKHEQELYVNILTSQIPVNTYDARGTVTIDTNGGLPYIISFTVMLEGLEIAADRFRVTYVPLIAACAGLIGSFGDSPLVDFLAGAFIAGIVTYVFAKLFVKPFLNKGIDIFKLPPVLIQVGAVGVVILTIMSHSDGGSAVRKASYTPQPAPVSAPRGAPVSAPRPVPVPAQAPETPSINITKAIVAAGLDTNQIPLGIDTSFPSGNKRLYYYVSYNGGIPDSTVFVFKWYKYGNQIRENEFTTKYAAGNVWNYLDYDFQPGQYEVQLYANGQQLDRTSFSVSVSSADTQRAEEQRQPQAPETPSMDISRRQAQEERAAAEQRQREQAAEEQRRRQSLSYFSGVWKGEYSYSAGGRRPVPFTMETRVDANAFAGVITEPNTFGDPSARFLRATVSGLIEGNDIQFTKTYDGTGGQSHSVSYHGNLDTTGRRLTGTWRLGAGNGNFTLDKQ